MADILSSGQQVVRTAPRRPLRRRWLVLVVVGALVLAGLYWATHRGPGVRYPNRPAAGVYYWRDGQLVRIDLRTGRRSAVSGLPNGALNNLVPVHDGVVVTAYGRSYLVRGSHVVRRLPTSTFAVADSGGAAVWTQNGVRARRVALSGRAGSWVRLPPGTSLVEGIGRYLVLSTQFGYESDLYDPSARRVRARYSTYLGAATDRIAWAPGTTQQAQPRITDLRRGRTVIARLPTPTALDPGGMSPDGRWLVVLAYRPPARVLRGYLVDAGTGRFRPVPAGLTGLGSASTISFTADSRWLVVSSAVVGRTWLWRIGAAHADPVADTGYVTYAVG